MTKDKIKNYENKKTLSAVDKIVAANIVNYSILAGKKNNFLAKELNISHQQLFKYKACKNRISASNLYKLAKVLNRNVDEFFVADVNTTFILENCDTTKLIQENQILSLVSNFLKLKNDKNKNAVINLIKTLNDNC